MSPWCATSPEVGVTKPIFSVPLFSIFPLLSKQTLAIEYHVYIWQVLPQLSCGDTCQIWMWFRESNRYFCNIEYFAYGEISERSFSNPHPWDGVFTKSPSVNFSASKIFDLAKKNFKIVKSHSYLTGATTAELQQHLSIINVMFNS